MTSPSDYSIYNFTSPSSRVILRQHIRNAVLAHENQARILIGQLNDNGGSFGRLRGRKQSKDLVSLFDSYSQGPPVYPFYLDNTIYSALVKEQYDHYCQKYKNANDNNSMSSSNAKGSTTHNPRTPKDSLSAPIVDNQMVTGSSNTLMNTFRRSRRVGSSSSSNSPGTTFFEELDTKPIFDRLFLGTSSPSLFSTDYDPSKYDSFTTQLELKDLRLPTAWSTTDRGEGLELGQDFNEITYKGKNKEHGNTASAIRSNHSIKPQCGLFYYEVKIEKGYRGNHGHITVGICSDYCRLDRMPGCDEDSYGYHGESGYLTGGPLRNSIDQHKYETGFGIGDTIGCGVDFCSSTLFYTKNGVHLGTAFRHINDKPLYPYIGFMVPGEKITVNFGQTPSFMFDIGQYRESIGDSLALKILETTPLTCLPSSKSPQQQQQQRTRKTSAMDDLVMDYLNHAGYIGTCLKMKNEMAGGNDGKDEEKYERIKIRQDICAALRDGQINQVFIKCEQHYPDMLSHNPRLLFRLECQKFIDLVKSLDHQRTPLSSPKSKTNTGPAVQAGDKRRRSMLEMDDSDKVLDMDENDDDDSITGGYNWSDLQRVIDFGQYLHTTYAPLTRTASNIQGMMELDGTGVKDDFAGVDVKAELTSTFSILAYADPATNPSAYLCELGWREKVASDLNEAILVTVGEQPASSLEKVYRQANVTIRELVLKGNGQASMIPTLDSLF